MKKTAQWWVTFSFSICVICGCSSKHAAVPMASTAETTASTGGTGAPVGSGGAGGGVAPAGGSGGSAAGPVTCGTMTCANPLAAAASMGGIRLSAPCCLPEMAGCGFTRGDACVAPQPPAPLCPTPTFPGATSCCQSNGMCGTDGTPIGMLVCSSFGAVANAKCDGTTADAGRGATAGASGAGGATAIGGAGGRSAAAGSGGTSAARGGSGGS